MSGLIIFDEVLLLLLLLTMFIFTMTRMNIVSEILSPQNKKKHPLKTKEFWCDKTGG